MLYRKRTLTWYFLKMLVSVAKKVLTFSKKGVARISHSGIISPCRRARGAEANHWMWAFSSGGERFPDTEEVTSSNLVTPTKCSQLRGFASELFCFAPPSQEGTATPKVAQTTRQSPRSGPKLPIHPRRTPRSDSDGSHSHI